MPPRLFLMESAAARAMSTRFPFAIEPEASSTSVTLRGLLSSLTSGAWNVIRATCISLCSGCSTSAVEIAKLLLSLGRAYW